MDPIIDYHIYIYGISNEKSIENSPLLVIFTDYRAGIESLHLYKKFCFVLLISFVSLLLFPIQIFLIFQIHLSAAHVYDAVMIYSRAVTEVLASGGSPLNGTVVFNHIKSRSYESKLHFINLNLAI